MNEIHICRRTDAQAREEYGCSFRRLLPWRVPGPSDNGMGIARIEPTCSSEPHVHDEYEHFVVMQGEGCVIVDGARALLGYGDAVLVRPGERHHFENASAKVPFEVLCLWSIQPLDNGA